MTRKLLQTKEKIISLRKKIFVSFLLFTIIFSGGFYGLSIKNAILHAGTIKSLERESKGLELSISSLNSEYLALKNSITPNVMGERGFVVVPVKQFISKKTLSNVVSFAHEI
ncbi:MAG: hypothetical protein Q7R78_03095 [bacterium]|nr:hypothetical protein [bacterium]